MKELSALYVMTLCQPTESSWTVKKKTSLHLMQTETIIELVFEVLNHAAPPKKIKNNSKFKISHIILEEIKYCKCQNLKQ